MSAASNALLGASMAAGQLKSLATAANLVLSGSGAGSDELAQTIALDLLSASETLAGLLEDRLSQIEAATP